MRPLWNIPSAATRPHPVDTGARRPLAMDLGNPTELLHLSVNVLAGRRDSHAAEPHTNLHKSRPIDVAIPGSRILRQVLRSAHRNDRSTLLKVGILHIRLAAEALSLVLGDEKIFESAFKNIMLPKRKRFV